MPSGDPSVSWDPELGEPSVLGVEAEPGEVIFGAMECMLGHMWEGEGHGKPVYAGWGGYNP